MSVGQMQPVLFLNGVPKSEGCGRGRPSTILFRTKSCWSLSGSLMKLPDTILVLKKIKDFYLKSLVNEKDREIERDL